MPNDIIKQMEKDAYAKMFKFRDKLKAENNKRKIIEDMDKGSKYLAKTVNHIQTIYPKATF